MTATSTMTGRRYSPVALRSLPSAARMNENSPIWTIEEPPFTAVYPLWPDSRIPSVDNTICPMIVTMVMMMIGTRYSIR